MNLNQIKDETQKVFEEFKAANDAPAPDVLSMDKIDKLNQALDILSAKLTQVQKPTSPSKLTIAQPQTSLETKSGFLDYARSTDFVTSDAIGYPGDSKMDGIISGYLNSNSVIRKLSSLITTSRESLEFVRNKEDVDAQWSNGTTAPESIEGYEKINIPLNDLIAQPKVTQKLIDDVEIDFETWLAQELGQIFIDKENDAFINGDGLNKPRGILSYVNSGQISSVKTGDASNITVDGLINLIYSLDDVYATNASMIMNKATVQAVRKLKDSNGQYLWMPGILSGKSDTIMGVNLYTMNNIPAIANGNICALYGNFNKGYLIVDRQNISIQKDPFSSKPFVSFYCTKRVGADVINAKAIKALKISA